MKVKMKKKPLSPPLSILLVLSLNPSAAIAIIPVDLRYVSKEMITVAIQFTLLKISGILNTTPR